MMLYQKNGLLALMLVVPVLLFAQFGVTGKIRGRVINAGTGKPLSGANVIILPVTGHLGAMTDTEGNFIITNIPVKTHSVKASYMGFDSQVIEGVQVFPGKTTKQDFELAETAIEGEEITVTAEAQRTAVNVRDARSTRELKGDDVEHMPVIEFADVLTSSAGIVETGGGLSGGIHVRGGRTGELKYVIDGLDVTDPVTGQKGMDVDVDAIEAVSITQNFFSAAYGGKLSGVTEIVTKSGGRDRLEGSLKFQTDNVFSEPDLGTWGSTSTLNNGFNKYNFFLAGPVPGLNGDLRFSVSGAMQNERQNTTTFIVMPHNAYRKASGIVKLTYSKENSPFKVEYTFSADTSYIQEYSHYRSLGNWLDDYLTRRDNNTRHSLKFSGVTTFLGDGVWTLMMSRYSRNYTRTAQNGSHYTGFRVVSTMLPWVNWAYYYADDDFSEPPRGRAWWTKGEYYNTQTREWQPLPIGKVKDNWMAPAEQFIDSNGDGVWNGNEDYVDFNFDGQWNDEARIQDLPIEDQYYYYFYAKEVEAFNPITGQFGFKDPITDEWQYDSPLAIANRVDALNARWGDTGYWYSPALLDTASIYHDSDSKEVLHRDFNADTYNLWLGIDLREQDALIEFQNGDLSQEEFDAVLEDVESDKLIYELDDYQGDIHWAARWNRDDFGLFSFGFRPAYAPHNSDVTSVDFDWTSQLNLNNEIQFGINYRQSDIRSTNIQFLNPHPYFDHWKYTPLEFAAYSVWRFEYEDLISDLGVRVNGFDAQARSLKDPTQFSLGTQQTPVKLKIAPRLSVSFAASDKTSLSLNYGYKYQLAKLSEMFMNLQADISNGYPILGDPDLEMFSEKAYDVLIKHEFTPEIGIEIDAFYRDQFNLMKTEEFTTVLADGDIGVYTAYTTNDFAKIKGIDFRFNLLGFYGFSGEFNYSFLDAKGTGSSSREYYYNYMLTSSLPPTKEYPLEFDITHSVDANMNYGIAPGAGPAILGLHPFGYSNLNIQFGMQSGAPYTAVDSKGNPLEIGANRMPWIKHLNLKFEKAIPLIGKKSLTFFIQVWNLFDFENVVSVNAFTGLPDTNGYPPKPKEENYPYWRYYPNPETGENYTGWEEMYRLHLKRWKYRMKNPGNYGSPRSIILGTSIRF